MLYQSCWNNLVTGLIVPSSLLQFVNSLFQTCSNKFGASSANTSCQQLVNRLVTTCLQVCSNLCVFTCVGFRLFLLTGFDNGLWAKRSFTCRKASCVEGLFFSPKRKGNAIIPPKGDFLCNSQLVSHVE